MPHPAFDIATAETAELRDAALPASWVTGGAPSPRSTLLHRPRRHGLAAGVWACESGSFNYSYSDDETIVLLAGRVRLTDADGRVTVISAGDVGTFRGGTTVHWEILEPVRKVLVVQEAVSLPARLVRKAQQAARRFRSSRLFIPGLVAGGGTSAAGLVAVVPW